MNLRVFYVDGAQTSRQINTLSHRLQTLFSHPPKPFSGCHAACIPCTKHNDAAVMPGAAVAGVPPASSPARPDGPSSPDEVMLCITPSGLPGPHPSAPRGLPLVSLCPRAVTAPRFATGLSRPWDSGFFLRSLRLPGDLALLRTPRSRAHSSHCIRYARSPLTPNGDRRLRADYFLPGRPMRDAPVQMIVFPWFLANLSHCLRGVADDRCAATALPLRLVEFFFSLYALFRQTSLCSDCPGRALAQRSP